MLWHSSYRHNTNHTSTPPLPMAGMIWDGACNGKWAADQRLSRLLAIKMIWEQISFANRLAHQSSTSTNKQWQWQTQAEHSSLTADLRVDHHLWGDWAFLRTSLFDVSGTKLTLGLQVGFICSRLTVDKLFPVNPRVTTGPPKMSLLLEAKSMPALIFKPKLIIVPCTDDLDLKKTSNQQQQMRIQNLNRRDQVLHHGSSYIVPQTVQYFN